MSQTGRLEWDGIYNGVYYKALDSGEVDAKTDQGVFRFSSVETFLAAADANSMASGQSVAEQHGNLHLEKSPTVNHANAVPPPTSTTPRSEKNGCVGAFLFIVFVCFSLFVFLASSNGPRTSTYSPSSVRAPSGSAAERMVQIINTQFGAVCEAKLEGFFSNTLRLDWTGLTTKLHSITVFAAIGQSKETLYSAGIRYLKFPNNSVDTTSLIGKLERKPPSTNMPGIIFPKWNRFTKMIARVPQPIPEIR